MLTLKVTNTNIIIEKPLALFQRINSFKKLLLFFNVFISIVDFMNSLQTDNCFTGRGHM